MELSEAGDGVPPAATRTGPGPVTSVQVPRGAVPSTQR